MTLIPVVVDRYLRRVARERSGLHSHSKRHHPRTRTWEDHMLSSDTDASEVPSGHTQHLFIMQSSLPHDVEPYTRKKTSTFTRQMSEDVRYRRRPISRSAVGSEYPNSDSLLSSSDGVPVVTTVGPGTRSRSIPRKGQSRKLPNVLSLLTAQEASMYVVNNSRMINSSMPNNFHLVNEYAVSVVVIEALYKQSTLMNRWRFIV